MSEECRHDTCRPHRSRREIGVALLPLLACMFCPAHIVTWAAVLGWASLGTIAMGVWHEWAEAAVMMSSALAILAAWHNARRCRRHGVFFLAAAGALAVLAGCVVFEIHALAYAGAGLHGVAGVVGYRNRNRKES